eukprot:TRINITY_DN3069_c0_g1_i1.p1 TRINITY_DN3069_c0_g1~~TRINITY_DN3069_c0_g1_i1.p1  ORF type:complete len:259 (-),score=134.93 TRINITY_DN3069_c0_g1_i1:103-879(-)
MNEQNFDSLFMQISKDIQLLTNELRKISNLSIKIGTNNDTTENRETLQNLIEKVSYSIKNPVQELRTLESLANQNPQIRATRIVKANKLKTDYQKLLVQFQDLMKQSTKKLNETPVPKQMQQGMFNPFSYNQNIETQNERVPLISSEAAAMAQDDDNELANAILNEREKSMREVEQSIIEVNQLFKDFNSIVYEQAPMIEDIEAQMNNAVAETEAATGELEEAASSAASARSRKCCIAGIILVIIAVIVLIVTITQLI